METKKRLLYIDNIRLLMIVFVVVHHIAVTYSGMGSWYYREGKPLGFLATTLFGFYQSLTQGYFMGILFLVAGYFTPGAYDRKGFGKFLLDRFVRLGIPTLIYTFAVNPFVRYYLMENYGLPRDGLLPYYINYITSLDFLSGTGPLWFALALLVFSAVYALARLISGRRQPAFPGRPARIGWKHVLALAGIIAALAFTIRVFFPVDTSVCNFLLCFFAQYVVLFPVGMLAYRRDLFSKLDSGMGRLLLILAPTASFGVWGAVMLLGGAPGDMTALNGGLTWQSAAFSIWESCTAAAMDIGLLTLFRERFNTQGRLVKALSASAFAVYVFHTPVIVAITRLFAPVQWLPGFKFIAMVAVCLPVCFGTAYLLKKIPLLRRVL